MSDNNCLNIRSFFPFEGLHISNIQENDSSIEIKLKSITNTCICPKCNTVSEHCHGTYKRKVQDLPILGKNVTLHIRAREYYCDNEDCEVSTIAETFNGFIDYYSRMTERLEDFLCSLALETSCEGSARISKLIGIRISGDTIIRLLLKRYENQPSFQCGPIIGVDDFATKKRHNYGTIIVDEATHKPVTILEGRDGKSLKEWLKNNKHVKVVTRDRASAYAKAISEELPDAMQVADRFHLHQNLLEAIKKSLNRELPATIKIPKEPESEIEVDNKNDSTIHENCSGKKNATSCG